MEPGAPVHLAADALLTAYDDQLRTNVVGAIAVDRLGPLLLVTFPGGHGFVTYRDLSDADAATIRDWVGAVVDHYRTDSAISLVEWKTRGHDHAPGLHQALLDHGFDAEEPESVMIGQATALAIDVALPDEVVLRQVHDEADVRRMCEMQREVSGDVDVPELTAALLHRLALDDGMELWVAEVGARVVSTGRLEPVPGTDFAGIWGGATVRDWRHRGLYRALTAVRARSALRGGRTLIHSDSTPDSRPILERSGFAVTTTTPYVWRRP